MGRSVPPEVLEPRRRHFGVADCMLDIAMPEVGLQRPRVVSPVGERVAACAPEHVRVVFEPQLRFGACTLDRAGKPRRGERRSALRGENERRLGLLLALEPPQGAQLVPEHGVRAGSALLDPADMQGARSEVDLIPVEVDQLGSP
jgi:hypothetical protein